MEEEMETILLKYCPQKVLYIFLLHLNNFDIEVWHLRLTISTNIIIKQVDITIALIIKKKSFLY